MLTVGLPNRREILIPSALFLQGILTLSPIPPLLGIRGVAIYFAVYLVIAFELICNARTIPMRSVCLCAAVWLGYCIASLYWCNVKIAFLPLFFIGSVLITSMAERSDVQRFITICTGFLIILLVLSWVGFFYVLLGGHGLFSIANPDGRENIFYLTTFSNYRISNSIRPSAIFDEPGTFSFVLCAIAALRVIYRRKTSVSIALLLLGTVTFGFTHFAFLFLFLFFLEGKSLKFRMGLLLAVSIAMVLAYFAMREAVDAILMWKFTYHPETRTISGDNRSEAILLALSHLSWSSFLWGLDSTGITGGDTAFEGRFGNIEESPLGPLVTGGIFVSFPYYLFMMLFFINGIRSRERNIYLAVGLLFLPRPYVTSFGYSVLAMLFLLSLDKEFLNRTYTHTHTHNHNS